MTTQEIESDIQEYRTLLNSSASEETLHEFLANHVYFFNGIVRTFDSLPLYSKIRLGSEYEMDFCCMDPTSYGPEWTLIEIEKPEYKLFTKDGNPTKELTHAIRQVQDWQQWISDNKSYAQKLLPYIDYPKGVILIGRGNQLIDNNLRTRMKRINYDYRSSLVVRTFDSLLNKANSILELAKNNNGIVDLGIPPKAKNHKDLKAGLPKEYEAYLSYYDPQSKSSEIARKLKSDDRNYIKNQDFDSFHDVD